MTQSILGSMCIRATISVAVRYFVGQLVMEAILETKAETILQFFRGLRGSLHVTFEEGTWAAWLHDLLLPHVARVLVCDSRKNALLKAGNKNDRIDARKLSDLLYMNKLSAVYHGEQGLRTLKELARSYITITRDLTRVMSRLKAIYRSWAIPCAGQQVYAPRYRAEWLAKISEAGVRRRAELYYVQFDILADLRQGVRRELLAESRKHPATKLLRQIPSIGPIRAALIIAIMQTPNRFRTKRQLGLLWLGTPDLHQRGIPLRRWPTETIEKDPGHPRVEPQPQSRFEKYLQGCGHTSGCHRWTLAEFLRSLRRSRNEAAFGTTHLGAQDRRHHFDRLEEGGTFRRRTSETTSSLSVCGELSLPDSFLVMAFRFF